MIRRSKNSNGAEKNRGVRLGLGSFELPDTDTFSRKKFRANFIRALDDIAPEVGFALYQRAFFQFVRLAWAEFPQSLSPRFSAWLEDEDFVAELERLIIDSSVSPFQNESIHPVFAELLLPSFNKERELLINNPRGIVMRELLRPLRILFKTTPRTFRNWATLQKIKSANPVCQNIIEWSKSWNLDADWCRDYAVVILCNWLADQWLQWTVRWEPWEFSLRKAIATLLREDIWKEHKNAYFPVDEATVKLMSRLSQDFHFTWKGLDFTQYRWNVLSRYKSGWVQECNEDFRTYLAQYQKDGGKAPTGAIGKFRAKCDMYVSRMEKAAKQAGLVKTPRRWATEHLTWAVRFQVQEWPLSRISKFYSKPLKTSADGIKRVLDFIILTQRPDLPSGMPKGTRLSVRRRIVRN